MFEEKILSCKDCGKEFVFSVSEQEFFAEKGFKNTPSRCPECRAANKSRRNEGGYGGGYGRNRIRQTFKATCAECGGTAEVPFKPTEDRPVYCEQCYRQKRRVY